MDFGTRRQSPTYAWLATSSRFHGSQEGSKFVVFVTLWMFVLSAPTANAWTLLSSSSSFRARLREEHWPLQSFVRWEDLEGSRTIREEHSFNPLGSLQLRNEQPWSGTNATESALPSPTTEWRIYCDLDGVLVDFKRGIRGLYADDELNDVQRHEFHVDALCRPNMWERVKETPDFFAHLHWMPEGPVLWDTLRQIRQQNRAHVHILTGVPCSPHAARGQKFAWCRRELGIPVKHTDMAGRWYQHCDTSSVLSLMTSLWTTSSISKTTKGLRPFLQRWRGTAWKRLEHLRLLGDLLPSWRRSIPVLDEDCNNDDNANVITCWSHNKHWESGPGAILIDDRIQHKEAWEAKGGIFLHHRDGSALETIAELRALGILPSKTASQIGPEVRPRFHPLTQDSRLHHHPSWLPLKHGNMTATSGSTTLSS